MCIDKFPKHLQVSFLLCLLGESSCSYFKSNCLAISCEVTMWFWYLAARHEAHLLGLEWEILLIRTSELPAGACPCYWMHRQNPGAGELDFGEKSENSGVQL